MRGNVGLPDNQLVGGASWTSVRKPDSWSGALRVCLMRFKPLISHIAKALMLDGCQRNTNDIYLIWRDILILEK